MKRAAEPISFDTQLTCGVGECPGGVLFGVIGWGNCPGCVMSRET